MSPPQLSKRRPPPPQLLSVAQQPLPSVEHNVVAVVEDTVAELQEFDVADGSELAVAVAAADEPGQSAESVAAAAARR